MTWKGGQGWSWGEVTALLTAVFQAGCGWAMAQPELLWAAAGLMLLGVAVSACVRCQLYATKRGKDGSQGSRLERPQRFEVIRSCSAVTRRPERIKEPEHLARKAPEELSTSCHVGFESSAEPRYQNFLTEDCLHEDAAYVEPVPLDYYSHNRFFSPPNDEDSHSYQNVIIGDPCRSELDDAEDYENSTAIEVWKVQQAKAMLYAESQDEEPDYVNTDPTIDAVVLSK
ncbi:linker for activation of T-cells family member 2 isoform X1 [Gallus gallus]|uniref:linker for activation of T-cells family member 2 isoform X1 n=2 Tax=Gallus gallus TaxID=9031 RepID=UPI0002C87FC6|nr:linker for activation of T-cells family member 2 isoform X1 [Gallus gallus]XP_046785936.1 linker for activation of T-cells family member 2 isoform X1 [Gallus gallus]XP_046785937.1 linker for activation of T-cells family member 2 isoform X1 [Gallus gallus]|eukprot:XP_004950573.2 linker for activation of T-cells family member 2 isoform X1 [Gallus gallus]